MKVEHLSLTKSALHFYFRSELDFLASSEHYQSNMFHVKIEMEQHKNGISLQCKTRDNSKKPDLLFSTSIENTQFQDLFPQRNKKTKTSPVIQPKV